MVLGDILGGGTGFNIGGSTLGAGRWCTDNVCTLGGGRGGIGRTGGLDTLGDWRRGNIFRGEIRSGKFLGVPGDAHRWHASHNALITLSWELYTVMEVSLMAPVSVLMLCRTQLAGVTVGTVIY